MQMQEGVGRSGYRLLAAVFLGIGVLGLVTTLYAFQQAASPRGLFDWLGFGLSLVALVALFSLTFVILWPASGAPAAPPAPAGAPPVPLPTPGRAIDFEFAGPHAPEKGPETVVPLPRPAPPPIVQPNVNLARDTKGWPRRQPPSGLTMGERRELQQQAVQMLAGATGASAADADVEFVATPPRRGPAAPAPAKAAAPPGRGREMAVRVEAPVAIARVAGPDDDPAWNPDGMTRGKCGSCGCLLYAPPERPVHLRCPKCGKLTLLR